jgi:hypothetical protein
MQYILKYIFVISLFSKIGLSQMYFNNRYDNFNNGDLNTGINLLGQDYLMYGCAVNSFSFYSLNLGIVNPNGVRIKNKTYNWGSNLLIPNNNKCLINSPHNFIISGGNFYKLDTSLVFLWRFNENLDSLDYKEYGFLNKTNQVMGLIKDSTKYIYMVGWVDSLYKNTDILLIKTDTSGNEIWKKKIGLAGWDEAGYCIKTCANGNLLIGGLKDLRGSPQQGPFIMRLDTSGNILWQNYYPSATYANGSFDVMEMPNGDIVFTGGKGYAITGNGTLRRPMLTRLDAGGNLIWQKEYGQQAVGHDFFTFLVNEKNNFVISGEIFLPDNTGSGMVYEINQNGDSLFSREYRILPNSQNYFRDIVHAPDKGYCFSGFVSPMNGDGGNQDIWLLKTDSTFCESAVSCGYPTSVRDISYGSESMSVYPNPTNSIINLTDEQNQLQSATIVIKNYLGQIVFTAPFSNHIDISSLSSGMYFLTVQDKSNKRTVKVVKE